MKTTVELPDDLFHAAKLTAAKRRISLKRLFSQALRREISDEPEETGLKIAISEEGVPYLPKRGCKVRSEDIERLDAASEE